MRTATASMLSLGVIAALSLGVVFRSLPSPKPRPAEPESRSLFQPRHEQRPIHEEADAPTPFAGLFDAGQAVESSDAGWPYHLDRPDKTLRLSRDLEEISDVSFAADGKSLWAVDDELGTLYRLSTEDGEMLEQVTFAAAGDYESLREVGEQMVVGRSDGVLFVVGRDGGSEQIDTGLGAGCNLEGMERDARGRLLLACKSEMPSRPRNQRSYAVFAFDLATKKTERQPVMVLTKQSIDDWLDAHQGGRTTGTSTDFAPSGMAIHPKTGELFVVSSRDTLLVVFNAKGSVVRVESLDEHLLPQLEGITFAPDGTMFLSSEARGDQPLVQRYHPR